MGNHVRLIVHDACAHHVTCITSVKCLAERLQRDPEHECASVVWSLMNVWRPAATHAAGTSLWAPWLSWFWPSWLTSPNSSPMKTPHLVCICLLHGNLDSTCKHFYRKEKEFRMFVSPSGRSFFENCCPRSGCRATKPALYLQESLKEASHLT